jgi:hypothetical protein
MVNPGLVVLSSPMLMATCSVRRRSVLVNGQGRGKTTEDVIPNVKAIINAQGANGQRRSETSSIGYTTYSVITKYPLRKQAAGILPDIVLYAGMELLVIELKDYTRYGGGWVEATCTSQQIADAPTGRNQAGNS